MSRPQRKSRFLLGLAISRATLAKGDYRTQEELAAYCDVTKQAIQDIEYRALRKCRRMLKGVFVEHFNSRVGAEGTQA